MRHVRVAAAVLNQTPLDWRGNWARIQAAIAEARHRNVSILCLPELCISGYGCEDAFLAPHVQRTAWEVLQELLPETRGMVVSLGLPVWYQGSLFNAACLAVDGRVAGLVGKQNLAGDGLHYEPRWFKPWPNHLAVSLPISGANVPLGDLIFEVGGIRIGFEICEDAWVAQRPGVQLSQQGVDVVLNPSASHFAFGKHETRRRFVIEGSRAFHASYVYANLLGNEAGRSIYDGDAMVASNGRMLASGPRFSFQDWHLTVTEIDIDVTRMARSRQQTLQPAAEPSQREVAVEFTYPTLRPSLPSESRPVWEQGEFTKEEEFTRAVSLALFDYVRKSHSRGFVVSLSGGADSAAVSILATLALRRAYRELGHQEFLRKYPSSRFDPPAPVSEGRAGERVEGEGIDRIPLVDASQHAATEAASGRSLVSLDQANSRDQANELALVSQMLTCIYQATRNSSPTTRHAASTLAGALGATYYEWDVESLVQGYEQLVTPPLGRPLDWDHDDIARQNIQARVRSPSVWLWANLRGALLLATSNRSEAAVGYATMDGDTSGGLAPIAGIDKAFLRQWLRWFETRGPNGWGPLPELNWINIQQPTAELRPLESGQTDEADLMPYEVLDAIERSAIRDGYSPLEVCQLLEARFPQFSPRELGEWTRRFFQLWCRNQWKRERYAPSFHVDDESLDPKTWCRFPILSGGYERELEQLAKYLRDQPNSTSSPSEQRLS